MRLKSARLGLLALASVATAAATPPARAGSLAYSTSGTVSIPNEPTAQINGLDGTPIDKASDLNIDRTKIQGQTLGLGTISILPIQAIPAAGTANNAPPDISNAPFDVRISFNDPTLPSLDVKGAFHEGENYSTVFGGFLGSVDSITSSAPGLNANLPTNLAGLLNGQQALDLYLSTWDWDVTKLDLTANVRPVPEPSTFAVLAAGFCLFLGATARRRAALGRRRMP